MCDAYVPAADPMVFFPDLLEYPFRWASSRADTETWICVKEIYEESASRGSWQEKEGSMTGKGPPSSFGPTASLRV